LYPVVDLTKPVGNIYCTAASGIFFEVVDALATRIASFDKRTIMDVRRLVNVAGLPSDIEIESGWNSCIASMA
jgi:hypothetical protein